MEGAWRDDQPDNIQATHLVVQLRKMIDPSRRLTADQPPVLSDPHKINLIGGCGVLTVCLTDQLAQPPKAGPSRM